MFDTRIRWQQVIFIRAIGPCFLFLHTAQLVIIKLGAFISGHWFSQSLSFELIQVFKSPDLSFHAFFLRCSIQLLLGPTVTSLLNHVCLVVIFDIASGLFRWQSVAYLSFIVDSIWCTGSTLLAKGDLAILSVVVVMWISGRHWDSLINQLTRL